MSEQERRPDLRPNPAAGRNAYDVVCTSCGACRGTWSLHLAPEPGPCVRCRRGPDLRSYWTRDWATGEHAQGGQDD